MPPEPEFDVIETTAAGWLVERDRGLTRARERELARWLRADPRHAAAFDALAATWHLLAEVQPEPARHADVPEARRRRRMPWLPATLAAAAAVALAYVGWQRAGFEPASPTAPVALSASTEIGMLRKVDLPDGSVIQLNTDSAVDVRFSAAERRVVLARGEAHFNVMKNEGRPFIVSAAGVDVRVVGTVFNVRLRSESVDVLVTEGRVRVGSSADVAEGSVSAGQKVSISLAPAPTVPLPAPVDVATTEIKQTLAWQSHRLDFDATPLREIVAEINRYNRHKLVIDDERLDGQRFGGSFPANDYATFVRMLEADFGVVAVRGEGETRLRLKR